MPRPNIVLINCDDLGYGDLGCYGSTVNHTPNIDRLAAEGVRCTSWYAASPYCSPSRGAMLTGCYPPRIHFSEFDGCAVLFPGQGIGLGRGEVTMARLLKDAGYATMIVGKWHCGDQPAFLPEHYGFDDYYGLPYSNDMGRQAPRLSPRHSPLGLEYNPLPLIEGTRVSQEQPDLTTLTERYTERATAFIRAHQDQPFFLYLAHMYVHLPHYAPEAYMRRSENGGFGACLELLDWSTGAIRHELERLGLLENTLIVFTSDNGSLAAHGASNGPLRGRKSQTWEGGQRVPCIWFWKGMLQGGRTCSELLSHLDFLPTFARLAGSEARLPHAIDGKDVRAVLFEGTPRPEEENCFAYYWLDNLEAVRVGRYKLHLAKHPDKGAVPFDALYDLEADLGEQNDLLDQLPEVVAALRERAQAFREVLGDAQLNIPGNGRRPASRVSNPKPLTEYDPKHPYVVAMYDSEEIG